MAGPPTSPQQLPRVSLVKLPVSPTSVTVSPTPGQSAPRKGSWAKVIYGDKRYVGRIGRIAYIDSEAIGLKFHDALGTYRFRPGQVMAVTENRRPVSTSSLAERQPGPSELMPGNLVKIVVGDTHYVGRVGEVVSIGADVELKFKGSLGTYNFKRDHVVALKPV